MNAGRPGDQQATPDGCPALSELRQSAEVTLRQRIVLDDSHFADPNGPQRQEGQWAAGTLVRDDRDRVLWVKPDGWDGWTTPGGTVEFGETFRGAAQRETKEESGLAVSVDHLLVVVSQRYVPKSNPDRADPGGFVLYAARVEGSPVLSSSEVLGEPEETVEALDWFDQHPPLDRIDPVAQDCLSAVDIVPGETELNGDVWL